METYSITNSHPRPSKGSIHYSTNLTQHRHANARMVQNVYLIWLDNNINEEQDTDCRDIVARFKTIVQSMTTFIDQQKCIDFIENMNDENICLITSGALGQIIVPRIHDISNMNAIYIFCKNKEFHQTWSKEWPKIKSVSNELTPICDSLKQIVRECAENSTSISFINTSTDLSNKRLDDFDYAFIFTQTYKESLATMKFDEKILQQFLNYCGEIFAEDADDLKYVDVLERKYCEETPIWWYAVELSLYSMINRSLRFMDADVLLPLNYFIRDIHRQIERVYKEQKNEYENPFTVYHGQGLTKVLFDQIKRHKSGLISFNSLFCASQNRRISHDFANRALLDPDLIGVFFIIIIDPLKSSTPFAFINKFTCFDGKDEVLFPMGSIFRIREVSSLGENNRLFQVDLTLAVDTDQDVWTIKTRLEDETFPRLSGWERLGRLSMAMKQYDKAQHIFEHLLEHATTKGEKTNIYHQLDIIKEHQIKHKESIVSQTKSLEVDVKSLGSKSSSGSISSPIMTNSIYDKLSASVKIHPVNGSIGSIEQNGSLLSSSSSDHQPEKSKKIFGSLKKKLLMK